MNQEEQLRFTGLSTSRSKTVSFTNQRLQKP